MGLARFGGVVLVLGLAACTSAPSATPAPTPSPSVTTSGPAPAPATPSSPPEQTGQASQSSEGLELARTGGFIGTSSTITVYPDGTWQRDSRKGTLPADTMGRLQKLIADPRLMVEADRKQPARGGCADTYTYLLVVKHQLIHYDACPSNGDRPAVTLEIIGLVEGATTG